MKLDDKMEQTLNGHFHVKLIHRETGEVVDEYEEKNVLVIDSKTAITRALAGNSLGVMKSMKIGDDVGTGTTSDPEPASESYDENVMNVLYTINTLTIGYPNPQAVAFNVLVRGDDVMINYPGQTDIGFTSAALHTADGKVFSYKRFPIRSISDVLDLSIVWTIGF